MPLLGLGLCSSGNSHLDMVDLLIFVFGLYEEQQKGLYEEQQYDGFFENSQEFNSRHSQQHLPRCHFPV